MLSFRNVNFEVPVTHKCRVLSFVLQDAFSSHLYFAFCPRKLIYFHFISGNPLVFCLLIMFSQWLGRGRIMRSWIYFPGFLTVRFYSSALSCLIGCYFHSPGGLSYTIPTFLFLLIAPSSHPFILMGLNNSAATDPVTALSTVVNRYLHSAHTFVNVHLVNKPSSNFLILFYLFFLSGPCMIWYPSWAEE